METMYIGTRTKGGCTVEKVADCYGPEPLDPRHDLWNHSPTGLEWGYSGSGPAQLALAMLADALRPVAKRADDLAVALHQEFKREYVAGFGDDNWEMPAEEVREWAAEAAKRLDLSGWEDDAAAFPGDDSSET